MHDPMQRQINQDELDAFYHATGAAVWMIQYLEDVLVTLVAMKRHERDPTGPREAYDRLERERKGTLGSIYGRAKDEAIIPKEMEARFETFLEERNWLIHRSKKESSADLYNDDLRVRMIHRIIAVGEEAQDLRNMIYERMEAFVCVRGVDVASVYEVADETIRRLWGDT
jgi:hypothetical protein